MLYFIAVMPPKKIQEKVNLFKNQFANEFNAKHALSSPPHITLYMPFHWQKVEVDQLFESLRNFAQQYSHFNLTLDGFGAFAPRVIFVRVLESVHLDELHQQLLDQLLEDLCLKDLREWGRPYTAHMTIAHRDLKKEQFHQAWEDYSNKTFHAEFLVKGIVLLKHEDKKWTTVKEFFFEKDEN